MSQSIQITTHRGKEIEPFVPVVARLRIEIFREYPFLYDGKEEYERKYLKKFLNSHNAIVIIAWDGSTIIGASTGLPLEEEAEEIIKPIQEKKLDVAHFFYFGESVLRKEYRGKGIGHRFFDLREEHVRDLRRFSHVCFCTIDQNREDPKRPSDYLSLHPFWKKRGYQEQRDISCLLSWQQLGNLEVTQQKMIFWIKKL